MLAQDAERRAEQHAAEDRGRAAGLQRRGPAAERCRRDADRQIEPPDPHAIAIGRCATASARPPRVSASSVPLCSAARSAGSLDRRRGDAAARRGPGDRDVERVGPEAHGDVHVGRVVERVEEVLDDPVGRELHAGGQRARAAVDRQARLGALRPQQHRLEVRERRLRRDGVGLVGAAQDADHRAHLLERPPAALLDVQQGRRGLRALLRRAALGERRQLAQSALQQLVEIGRQARAVHRDLHARPVVARLAQGDGLLLETLDVAPAHVHEPRDDPHARQQDADVDAGLVERRARVPAEREARGADPEQPPCDRAAPSEPRACREDAGRTRPGRRARSACRSRTARCSGRSRR